MPRVGSFGLLVAIVTSCGWCPAAVAAPTFDQLQNSSPTALPGLILGNASDLFREAVPGGPSWHASYGAVLYGAPFKLGNLCDVLTAEVRWAEDGLHTKITGIEDLQAGNRYYYALSGGSSHPDQKGACSEYVGNRLTFDAPSASAAVNAIEKLQLVSKAADLAGPLPFLLTVKCLGDAASCSTPEDRRNLLRTLELSRISHVSDIDAWGPTATQRITIEIPQKEGFAPSSWNIKVFFDSGSGEIQHVDILQMLSGSP